VRDKGRVTETVLLLQERDRARDGNTKGFTDLLVVQAVKVGRKELLPLVEHVARVRRATCTITSL